MKYFHITEERGTFDITEYETKQEALNAQIEFGINYDYISCNEVIEGNIIRENKDKVYYCTICHKNTVDALNGYDTCDECLRKV